MSDRSGGAREGLLAGALHALGIDRFACEVHDRCLPADGEGDLGCGAPGGDGASGFLGFLAELGFNVAQLGPPGRVSPVNLSPYDGTVFSRSELQLSWSAAAGAGLFDPAELRAGEGGARKEPDRCDYPRAFTESARRWALFHARWEKGEPVGEEPRRRLAAFRAGAGPWLESDALHRELSERHGTTDSRLWPRADGEPSDARLAALREEHALAIDRFAREQWLLHEQHLAFRARAHALQMEVWGDLQVGLSHADAWAHRACLLPGFALGAPPSRTNPMGQPWGYPVLDPGRREGARKLLEARLARFFADYDGIRVDHPHGLVCPWVYREGTDDPHRAVREGGRLHSIGARADLADLPAFDIARPDQLDPSVAPWADDFVRELDDGQVERYAWMLDALVAAAGGPGAVASEALSTVPYPLLRVLERHGLGRFRVTTKAEVTLPDDPYRIDNARPPDWVMPGTHDTAPLFGVVSDWTAEVAARRAAYAAAQLAPDGVGRAAIERHLGSSRDALAQGELALIFVGPARHVMLWVSDVMGEPRVYNRPGVVHPENWTLRVPPGYRALHRERAARGAAFDPCASLALALASRPAAERRARGPMIRALLAAARAPLPALDERLNG